MELSWKNLKSDDPKTSATLYGNRGKDASRVQIEGSSLTFPLRCDHQRLSAFIPIHTVVNWDISKIGVKSGTRL